MAQIRTGKQYDHSTSETELSLHPKSTLEFQSGDLHNDAKQSLNIRETEGRVTDPAKILASHSSPSAFWAKGSFLLIAFAVIAAVIGTLTQQIRWYAVPIALFGAIVVLYLMAIILAPHGSLTEKGLLSVLQPFMRQVFTDRAKAPEDHD